MGSQYDASSKEGAQRHLEINLVAGVYLGVLNGNEIKYNDPVEASQTQTVVVSVFDDRAASRKLMIDAATRSLAIKKQNRLSPLASVGIAVVKHCPELTIVEVSDGIVSFEIDQYFQHKPK